MAQLAADGRAAGGTGTGRRLFQDGDPTTRLVLQDESRTSKGNVISTYGRLGA